MAVGQKDGASLLLSGAPRSNHRGQVTVFSKQNSTWEVVTRIRPVEQASITLPSHFCLCLFSTVPSGPSLRKSIKCLISDDCKPELIPLQVGSYFGGSVCLLDVDLDGDSDFAVVGAPLYYQPRREGKLFIYSLTKQVHPVCLCSKPAIEAFTPDKYTKKPG